MRVLLEDPRQLSPTRYRRFIQRFQNRGIFVDLLVKGEPSLALNGLVIGRDEATLLENLSTIFTSVFHKAGQALWQKTTEVIRMGFPWLAAEVLASEKPRVPLISRFDYVQDLDGHWWVLEVNADTPSGTRESIVGNALAQEWLPEARGVRNLNERFGEDLSQAYYSDVRSKSPDGWLGLVTTTGHTEDRSQMVFTQRLLQPRFQADGSDVILGDGENMRASHRGLTLCGRKVASLYRFLAIEYILDTPYFVTMCKAVNDGKLDLLNGIYGLLLQNKAVMAWIWEHRKDPCFTPEEQAAIERHLPPTWGVNGAPADVPQNELVLKFVFGREGEEVFFGEDMTPANWARLLQGKSYILQRKIPVVHISPVLPSMKGSFTLRGTATVGTYALHGRGTGFYTRFGGKITDAAAKWIATYAEQ